MVPLCPTGVAARFSFRASALSALGRCERKLFPICGLRAGIVLKGTSALCQHYLPVDQHLVPATLAVGLIAGVVASPYGNLAGAIMGVGDTALASVAR